MKKRIVGVTVCAIAALGAGSAFAGERAGNGEQTPAGSKAKSLCAYSGLEDHDFQAPVTPGVTQNWGQIIRAVGPLGGANSTFVPGEGMIGCNAHMYPNK